MSPLWSVFLEALHHASPLPFAEENMLHILQSFGKDTRLSVGVAFLGASLGHMLNAGLGYALLRGGLVPTQDTGYAKLSNIFRRYGFLCLILAATPPGNLLVIGAGMLSVPWYKIVLPVGLALTLHYGVLPL